VRKGEAGDLGLKEVLLASSVEADDWDNERESPWEFFGILLAVTGMVAGWKLWSW